MIFSNASGDDKELLEESGLFSFSAGNAILFVVLQNGLGSCMSVCWYVCMSVSVCLCVSVSV